MANVDDLIKIDMLDVIPPHEVEPILSFAPFHKLDGGFNTRDLSDGTHTNLKQGVSLLRRILLRHSLILTNNICSMPLDQAALRI